MRPDGAVVADLKHEREWARAHAGPPKRKRQPCRGMAPSNLETQTQAYLPDAHAAAQRAIETAARRAEALNRRAALYHDLGLVDAALRTTALADSIRAVLS